MWTVLLLAAACSGPSDPKDSATAAEADPEFLASCLVLDYDGTCREWAGTAITSLSDICAWLEGDYSESQPCPSDGHLGTCTLDDVKGLRTVYHYYSSHYDAGSAEAHCTGDPDRDGTFNP